MKKIYLTLIAFSLINISNAQSWIQQDNQTLNKINTIGFTQNNMTGWTFGDSTIGLNFQHGAIYKTTNQGFSWSQQNMGSDSIQIMDCHVFSNSEVIGVGKFQTTGDGAIIKTVNGGLTWNIDTTSIPDRVFDVEFESSSDGWIVGRNGYVGKSIDGGDNWTSQTSGTGEDLFAISFSSLTNGWAVGADGGTGGEILHTVDGGITWNLQSTTSTGDLTGVFAINSDSAYIVGQSGLILFTSDAGVNWSTQTSGSTSDLSDVEFANGLEGRAVGLGGLVLMTIDAGTNWSIEVSNTTNDISDVFYGANGINWYCGDNGDVFIYTLVVPNSIEENLSVVSKAYPNPAIDYIQIETSMSNSSEIKIYNLAGRLFFQANWNKISMIDISEYNPGMYFYVLKSENTLSSGKFVKK